CGLGLQCRMLAEKVGLGGKITGLDLDSNILETAASLATKANLSSRLIFDREVLPICHLKTNKLIGFGVQIALVIQQVIWRLFYRSCCA
ncbi:MAG: class I SAM-dependent methyltransferase, partial [Acetobacterium sp.]|nr:class I SAM-dependent methyltransferase [Acetobacterium sp.]